MEDIKWNIFTAEERVHIEALLARGEFDSITKVIAMDSLEKEYWINKILEDKKPIAAPVDSKVAAELEMHIAKGGRIESPEDEAAWQKKLDEEKEAHVEVVKKQRGRPKKVEVKTE